MHQAVDAAVEHWQKDVQAPARLPDQVGPNEKFACLADGVSGAVRPWRRIGVSHSVSGRMKAECSRAIEAIDIVSDYAAALRPALVASFSPSPLRGEGVSVQS
jgi:hypothetical protein